jgi:hypothetical protein
MEWLGMSDPSWRKMLLTLVASVVGLVVLISLLLMLRYKPPKKDRAALLYRRFVKQTGVTPAVGETPSQFAVRAAAESPLLPETIDAVTTAYLAARYGGGDSGAIDHLESLVRSGQRAAA